MRILLLHPEPRERGRLGLENVIWLSEPVALTHLAAMVPDHEAEILDLRLEEPGRLAERLHAFRPHVVAATAMTTDAEMARRHLAEAKAALGDDVVTIVGGHHATLVPSAFERPWIDAIAIGEGEETFRAVVDHLDAGRSVSSLGAVAGLRHRNDRGGYDDTTPRPQHRDLDTFPPPARHLIDRYRSRYFFTAATPLGSIVTSRGCSFDCNFCAIWEFYERKTRFLSPAAICDRLEAMEEEFVLFLDDNFLTKPGRLTALADEIERRAIRKRWGIQGRTDFIAAHPDLIRRLRDVGLRLVISGFESNDDEALRALLKRTTVDVNRRAVSILRELGIFTTGIFMVRPDFTEADFDALYAHIEELGVALPLVTIWTPLPGTALHRRHRHELLTTDSRFYDLLHAVVPTRLPRRRFYERFAAAERETRGSVGRGVRAFLAKNPDFVTRRLPKTLEWLRLASAFWSETSVADRYLADETFDESATCTST